MKCKNCLRNIEMNDIKGLVHSDTQRRTCHKGIKLVYAEISKEVD